MRNMICSAWLFEHSCFLPSGRMWQ